MIVDIERNTFIDVSPRCITGMTELKEGPEWERDAVFSSHSRNVP